MSDRPEPAAAPPTNTGESPPPDGQPSRGNAARWAARLVFLTLVALLVGVPAYNEFPHEVARWYQAAAIEQYYDGETEAAIATLGRAIAWDPHAAQYYLLRARSELDARQFDQALRDANRVLELEADLLQAYRMRSEIYLRLGDPKQSLAQWRLLREAYKKRGLGFDDRLHNEAAYFSALTGLELEDGLKDAEQAIDLMDGDYVNAMRGGLLLYKLQRPRAAARLLDRAVAEIEAERERRQARLASAKQARAYLGEMLDVSRFEQPIAEARAAAAKSYYYRSLAHEAVENKQQAEDDLRRSRELGGKPVVLAKALDDLKQEWALLTLNQEAASFAAVIDTRGFLHYRLGDLESALSDLTTAVDLAEATLAYLRQSPMYAQSESGRLTPAESRYGRQSFEEGVAVMRYHRALVYQKLGDTKKADGDLARVRELGFEPGPDLY